MSTTPIRLPAGVKLTSSLGPLPSPLARPTLQAGVNAPGVLARAWAALLSFVRGL